MAAESQLIFTDPVPQACDRDSWQRLFAVWGQRDEAPPGDIVVSFVNRPQMEALYYEYFGERKATDVLSIPYAAGPAGALQVMPSGEIVICLPEAREQAKQLKASLEVELSTLFVHGLLHVTGRDHDTPALKAAFHQDTRDIMETEKLTPVDLWSV